MDVFVKVAAHIHRGGTIDLVGTKLKKLLMYMKLTHFKTIKKEIIGHVIYIDNYENVVLNITQNIFKKFGKSRPYVINARNYKFNRIYRTYSDAIKFEINKESRKEEGKK